MKSNLVKITILMLILYTAGFSKTDSNNSHNINKLEYNSTKIEHTNTIDVKSFVPIQELNETKSIIEKNKFISKDLESELIILTKAITKSVEKDKESFDLLDFLTKLAGLIATLVGLYVTYKGLMQLSFFEKYKKEISFIISISVVLIIFYLLSNVLTSVLYIIIAILVLLISLVIASAFLIKFIDESYPEIKENIIEFFTNKSINYSLQKSSRKNIQLLESWLLNLILAQKAHGTVILELEGSFVGGYNKTSFELIADENIEPSWKNINNTMLIPIKLIVTVTNTETNESGTILNIQNGMIVINDNDNVIFKKLNIDGYQILGKSLSIFFANKMKNIIEEQIKWGHNLELYKSQIDL